MKDRHITPQNTEFVILSFEGPDSYSLAGGLGVRVNHLSVTLAQMGFTTHLFFVGDPHLKGEETRQRRRLILHRWCQWISAYHPNGVYQGEEGKIADFSRSIPDFVKDRIVKPAVAQEKLIVVLGEEWHTAEAMCRLSDALHYEGLRDNVVMFWNANNTFSFHRIDWSRLGYTTTITTVSKYMKHIMRRMGMNPLVIPNGIPRKLLRPVDPRMAARVRQTLGADLLLCKVARWDPDKCWEEAIAATARLKALGLRTVLLARGGIEPYGEDVLNAARSLDLTVTEARAPRSSTDGYLAALQKALPADIVDAEFHMPQEFLRLLYRASDAVLANSGHEPFGLVGLEAMAAGGIALVGSTGEDYAIPYVNAFVLETADPDEIVAYLTYLRDYPEVAARMRKAARRTARQFTWEAAVQNLIGKIENQARLQGILRGKPMTPNSEHEPPTPTVATLADYIGLAPSSRDAARDSTADVEPSPPSLAVLA